ncbi:penicillin-binding transpeptidase domain-containing protein [Chlorobium ferrooxidans]|uniref:beta-lactamase n=1 Tax=Chlorobium ferrooxidans DSM 13031 TaxID=377431 RepID=Q0YNY1_9CHLB|nr:penicillin-binding transpeptidase domain-containing protein [Chlorobium ferrooxidans]EAT57998.1 Beta-lactamase [Chlorobium ferrooxidans DSM 13031]
MSVMMKLLLLLLLLFSAIPACSGAEEIDRKLFGEYDTALVIVNRASGAVTDVNPALSARRNSTCSTFKIYNTLIGLQLGLLRGADDPWYTWDGVHRDIDGWNRNLTLREAFRVSAVPAFQALARAIGQERMKRYINRIGYGNGDISSGIDTFWLPRPGRTGVLISAGEQVALLNRLLDGRLPFSRKHVKALRDIMLVAESPKGKLYGKTGSGRSAEGREELGWFVGFLESRGVEYAFACNITGGEHPSGKAARAIVERVFSSQNLL